MPAAVRDSLPDFPEDAVLADVVHELAARVERGEPVVLDEVVREHADHADELRRLFPLLQSLADSHSVDPRRDDGSHTADHAGAGGTIGDFQIFREIGRGGMGIVYEAVQISLSRRVALKVLPFAAALDSRALARFEQESLAAAQLDHPHIVHVHSVGVDRGVHYYAMQFIEGQSLADVIAGMRGKKAEGVEESKRNDPASGGCQPPGAFTTIDVPQQNDRAARNSGALPSTSYQPVHAGRTFADSAAAVTVPIRAAGLSTDRESNPKEFYRAIARLAIAAAEALDYAHDHGVLHRDVKPGNLLLDENGKIYITDFGLARIETAPELTATGDLIGTLRYMSPEQATGARGLVDQRSDVYSLGASLYELLTLRPVFTADDRAALLKKIAEEDPLPPRRLDRSFHAELETILLKCLEKEPATRYGTAQALADDLTRYLEDKPLAAKAPNRVQRSVKWLRRHKPLVGTAGVLLVLATLLGAGALYDRFGQRTNLASGLLEEAAVLRGKAETKKDDPEGWSFAVSAARRAQSAALASTNGMLRQRATELLETVEHEERRAQTQRAQFERDKKLLTDFDDARLRGSVSGSDGFFDSPGVAKAYATAFREYGIDLEHLSVAEAQQKIATNSMRYELVMGVLDWSVFIWRARDPQRAKLLKIAAAAAADEPRWEKTLALALAQDDADDLVRSASSLEDTVDSSAPLMILGMALHQRDRDADVSKLFAKAWAKNPGDFWVNERLGFFSLEVNRDPQASVRFLTAAVAVRPMSAGAHSQLGNALHKAGQIGDAVTEYRRALEIDPTSSVYHYNLGNVLAELHDLDGAIAEYRRAAEIKPDQMLTHYNLGIALRNTGELEGAVAAYRRALELEPSYAEAHNNLGMVLKDKGDMEGAIDEYRQALKDNPDLAEAHNNLGVALSDKGDNRGAIAEYRRALDIKPEYAEAYNNLGVVLAETGDRNGAIAQYRRALELKPDYAEAHSNLGNVLKDTGDFSGAIAEHRLAISLMPAEASFHYNLGNLLKQNGDVEGAIEEYHRAIEILPGHVNAYINLGSALATKGDLDGAIAQFRQALTIDPDHVGAHNQLGGAFFNKGNLEGAAAEFRRAVQINPLDALSHHNFGQVLTKMGNLKGAIGEFRRAVELKPGFAEAHKEFGIALSKAGDLEAALAEFQRGIEINPDFSDAHYESGRVLAMQGHLDEAIAEYRRTIELNPDYAEAHCNLGDILLRRGDFAEALDERRRGHALGIKRQDWRYPSALWVKQAEERVRLDELLKNVLAGKSQAKNPAEQVALAALALTFRHKYIHEFPHLFAEAPKWYRDAFTAEPALAVDSARGHRYNAACAAVLAAVNSRPVEMTDAERAIWRAQAREWLAADLQLLKQQAESPQGAAKVAKMLQHWFKDPDLAAIRDADKLQELSDSERAACLALWQDVRPLLESLTKKPAAVDEKTSVGNHPTP